MVRVILVTILLGCATLSSDGQSKLQSLCDLPQPAPGAHHSVRISAVASFGTDMGVLTDAGCPSVQPTWFELSLKSDRNRKNSITKSRNPAKQRSYFLGSCTALRNQAPSCQSQFAKSTIPGGTSGLVSDEGREGRGLPHRVGGSGSKAL